MAPRGHANWSAHHRQVFTFHYRHRISTQRHQKRMDTLPSRSTQRHWRRDRLDRTVSSDQRTAD